MTLTLAEVDRLPVADLKLTLIVEDNALRLRYPTLDRSHIQRLRDALATGAALPPIAVQAGAYRLIYGWHRLEAYRAHDPEGTIPAHVLDLDDVSAVRLALAENNRHGLPMRKIDLQQAASVALRFGLTDAELVQLLQVPPGRLLELRAQQGVLPTRGPETGRRYMQSRGCQPAGVDLLVAAARRPDILCLAEGGGPAPMTTMPSARPALTTALGEPGAADPPTAGRFPAPSWLARFVRQPLADLGLTPGAAVVLKRSLRHLAGHELTEAQARAARFVSAAPPLSMAKQLVVLIWADALDLSSPKLMAVLRDLQRALNTLDLSAPELKAKNTAQAGNGAGAPSPAAETVHQTTEVWDA